MAPNIIVVVHCVLALFLLIELGLTGYLVGRTDGLGLGSTAPASIAFMLFNSVWSIIVLAYLAITPSYFPRAYHSLVSLGLLCVTAIFWFAGSIAIASFVGTADCDLCSSIKAAVAFGFFIWALFMGLAVLEVLGYLRSRGHSANADATRKPGQPYPGV